MPSVDLYLRLSIYDEGKDGLSRQEDDLREWADRQGLTVRKVWVDAGKSAYKPNTVRGSYVAAVKALKAGEVEHLAVWKLDRLSRKGAGEIGLLLDEVDKAGGTLHFLRDGMNSRDHRFTIVMLSEQARQESNNTGTRIRSKNAALLKAGLPQLGKRRYGYLPADPKEKRLVNTVEHPGEAQNVRFMFDAILEGRTISSLAKAMGWPRRRVLSTLKNPSYAGWIRQGDNLYPAHESVQRLVSQEDFDKVQARLALNAAPTNGGQRRHFASGLAACGVCGSPMIFRNEYICSEKGDGRRHPTIKKSTLEFAIRDALYVWVQQDHDDAETLSLVEVEEELASLAEGIEDVLSGLSAGLKMSQLLPHLKPLQDAEKAAQRRREVLLASNAQTRIIQLFREQVGEPVSVQRAAFYGLLAGMEARSVDEIHDLAKSLFTVVVNPGRGTERVDITPKRRSGPVE
jgi:DNA invertase Pin-like site-specific DNA recombinase